MPLSQARSVLEKTGWLSRQPPGLRDRLISSAVPVHLERGQQVYGIDEPAGGIFGLASGLVDVFIAPGPFPARLVYIARPGWWFGESAMATDTRRRAEIKARTTALVLHVTRKSLLEIEDVEPLIWKSLAALVVGHLDKTFLLAGCLWSDDPALRLAATLGRLSGAFEGETEPVELPISQEELGELAGLSRNSVSRSLTALEASGSVRRGYGKLLIEPVCLLQLIERPESPAT